jgi:hypothetical protein
VTEYDAFGNPIERTGPPAPPIQLAAPIPVIPTYGPSKTSWGARVVGFLVLLLFAAPLGIGGYVAYNAFHTAKDAVDAVEGVAIKPRVVVPNGTPATASPSTPATTGVSMLHASTLRKALATARRDPGGRLTLLRVAPERADLQLARKGGGLALVQLRADGSRSVIRSPGTPSRTIGFARVDVQAPSRLVRQAAHRLGRSTKAIDYVVLINLIDGPRWSAYFKGGAAFLGDAHGRVTRRIQ